MLIGRAGADDLSGGAGRDVFRFDDGDSRVSAPDAIADFAGAQDRINLRPIDAVEGGRNSAFHWIGGKGFSGDAGELASSISAPTSGSRATPTATARPTSPSFCATSTAAPGPIPALTGAAAQP